MRPDHISQEIWSVLPELARRIISEQAQAIALLLERTKYLADKVEELETRLNKNSGNSNKPPSSDGPFKKPKKTDKPKESKKKRGPKKSHKGHCRVLLDPTSTIHVSTGVEN